jgi:DNA-binding SARP family transcriptional activator/tetratricopeptide (TPR) repeat protein
MSVSQLNHDVRLLGPWEFRGIDGDVPIPAGQLRILLTSLVLSANETVRVDTLTEQLWPERPPSRAGGSVHTYVGRLRKLIGPDLIHTKPGGGYQLTIPAESVDVHRFRNLLRAAREAESSQEELTLLRNALRLWRGTPFADLYSTWLDHHVVPRLTEEWFTATGRRIDLELAAGHPEPLIAELHDLTTRYPARESLWLQLITALHRAGRRAEALDAYQRVRVTLRDELGIEPSEQLVHLQRQILLDGSSNAATPRQLPHDIACFTGRSDELAVLDKLLPAAGSRPLPTIVSIDGTPGVGKTTLAVHWAHRIAQRYPDAQLYLNLRGYGPGEPVTPEAAAETMLRALGVGSDLIPPEMDERSALLRSTLADRQALILLDNARDSEQVRPLLPGGCGLVLVTSRSQLRGLSIRDGARRVTLDRMPRQQSVELLAAGVGDTWIAEEPDAVETLIELCDHLPLGLAIVAERAQRAGSLTKVVAELENEHARLDNLETGEGNPHTSLRAALSWSYRALSSGAATMFRKLGMHPASDIELRAAAALADIPVVHAQGALDQLVAAHLAEQRRPNRYELHDLIQLYANELAEQDEPDDRQATIRRILDWYLHTAISADDTLIPHRRRDFLGSYRASSPPPVFSSSRQARNWFEVEFDSLRTIVSWAASNGFPGHAWRISVAMTTFFHHRISRRDGIDFYLAAASSARAAGEAIGEAYALNCLGAMYLDLDDCPSALSQIQQALRIFQAQSHRIGEAMALGNLALVHGQLGDDAEAQRYAMQAVKLHEELGYPRGVAQNLDNLGLAYMVAGEYHEAVRCFQQSLHTIQQVGDVEVQAWNHLHLGQAYTHLGDFPNSARAFRRAITINRALGNHRWEALILADFATMLIKAGHPAIARRMREQALTTLTDIAHPRAREIQTTLDAMGPE